jgi:hypothetical protein
VLDRSLFFIDSLMSLTDRSFRSFCPGGRATGQQWCAFTSTNIGISQQKAGKGVAVESGKDLVIVCSYPAYLHIPSSKTANM